MFTLSWTLSWTRLIIGLPYFLAEALISELEVCTLEQTDNSGQLFPCNLIVSWECYDNIRHKQTILQHLKYSKAL